MTIRIDKVVIIHQDDKTKTSAISVSFLNSDGNHFGETEKTISKTFDLPIRQSAGGKVPDETVDALEKFIAERPDAEEIERAFVQALTTVYHMGLELGMMLAAA